jgi:hypothetical protein
MESNKEKNTDNIVDENILEIMEVYIKVQNIQLLKYIAQNEEWNFKELCKFYL